MSSSNELARYNRSQNSGGVYPEALSCAVTLSILLSKLAYVSPHSRAGMTLTALYIWLTGSWGNIKVADDIPSLFSLPSTEPCKKHAMRTVYDGTISWCEYAQPYLVDEKIEYLWQPIPQIFNKFFQIVISDEAKHNHHEKPLINAEAKAQLFALLSTPWKTPETLATLPRSDKDIFLDYFKHCALADNTLTAIVRRQMIGEEAHHRSAGAYQRLESDRIRSKIFKAQNEYLQRIIDAATVVGDKHLQARYTVYTQKLSFSLLSATPKLAKYVSDNGLIVQYRMDTANGQQRLVACPSIPVGSRRFVEVNEICKFVARLHQYVCNLRPLGNVPTTLDLQSSTDWLAYYNAATNRIALLFILLTGVRPTHGITLLWEYYLGRDIAYVKDKGRLRTVWLCSYLQAEIKRYLSLQTVIRMALPSIHESASLWFYIDSHGQHVSLSNRSLRQVMNDIWPGVVPYQLRHAFCGLAFTCTSPHRLFDDNIDRLMGHSNHGEHLGSDNIFPETVNALMNYLNSVPISLQLREMHYV